MRDSRSDANGVDLKTVRRIMQAMGRKGGKIGGKVAASRLTRTERIARAKKAAAASAKVRSAKAKAKKKVARIAAKTRWAKSEAAGRPKK